MTNDIAQTLLSIIGSGVFFAVLWFMQEVEFKKHYLEQVESDAPSSSETFLG